MEPSMTRTLAALSMVVALATTGGCRGTARPQFFGPGSAPYQQHQAQQFDPYPETNIGPRVDGGRPDGYTAPVAEPYRGHPNQWTQPTYGR
jgi:hypothetical protein